MTRASTKYAIGVTVARSRKELPAAITNNRASARGHAVSVPREPLWRAGAAKAVPHAGVVGREAVVIEVAKLDPRVKFIAVYIDQIEASK